MCTSQSVRPGWKSKEYTAYNSQKQGAKKRGIAWDFTFDTWLDWWAATGKFELRGKHRGSYQMCRQGDTGPYAVNNVYCDTVSENSALPTRGKARPEAANIKTGDSLRGKPKSVAHKRNHAFSQLGKRYVTPAGVFSTSPECEQATGVKAATVMWRCKNNYQEQWGYQ